MLKHVEHRPLKQLQCGNSVRKGEEENIFPFQEEADVMFNSSLVYELAVLKQYVEPLLFGVDKHAPEYIEAKRLLKVFRLFYRNKPMKMFRRIHC